MENNQIVEELRHISNSIDALSFAECSFAMFPGWHEGFEEESEPLIKEAARAIIADDITEDEHELVSYKALATLIHYIADMMEE